MEKTKNLFQAETKQLLDLMINSIYSNRDVFLRELISNASDANDKYKYLSYNDSSKYPSGEQQIKVTFNKEKRYIDIEDNGIGMTESEVIANLGTIAKSGSKEFIQKLEESKTNKDIDIIGQFGVGFYSAFIVAKEIEVMTRSLDSDKGVKFVSNGSEEYTIEEFEKDYHGTLIRIHLKDDTKDVKYSDYLDEFTLRRLITKYSDYIRYPIIMEITKRVLKEGKDGKDQANDYEEHQVIETVNSMIPLWKKPKKEITEENLAQFYKNKFNRFEDPLISLSIKTEGMFDYQALLFVPDFSIYEQYSQNKSFGLDLYVKGVFIQDKVEELIPDYMMFVKGIVDSSDFSLNISREMLQKDPIITKISKNIEKKLLDKLKEVKEKDFEKYEKFFKHYGFLLKNRIYSSMVKFDKYPEVLNDLLVFNSLNNQTTKIDLANYVKNMKEEQKEIYYASGSSIEAIKALPQLAKYQKDGIDVLFFDTNIDEFCIIALKEYNKLTFKNITDDKSFVSEEDKKEIEKLVDDNKRLIDELQNALKDKVAEVSFSLNLVDAPLCIETKDGLSLNMEKILKEDIPEQSDNIKSEKVLKLNPSSDLFKKLLSIKESKVIEDYAQVLYDMGMMLQGFEVENKKDFVDKLTKLLTK